MGTVTISTEEYDKFKELERNIPQINFLERTVYTKYNESWLSYDFYYTGDVDKRYREFVETINNKLLENNKENLKLCEQIFELKKELKSKRDSRSVWQRLRNKD